jgi:hypothetical protein
MHEFFTHQNLHVCKLTQLTPPPYIGYASEARTISNGGHIHNSLKLPLQDLGGKYFVDQKLAHNLFTSRKPLMQADSGSPRFGSMKNIYCSIILFFSRMSSIIL